MSNVFTLGKARRDGFTHEKLVKEKLELEREALKGADGLSIKGERGDLGESVKGDKGERAVISRGEGPPSSELKADIYIDEKTGDLWLDV